MTDPSRALHARMFVGHDAARSAYVAGIHGNGVERPLLDRAEIGIGLDRWIAVCAVERPAAAPEIRIDTAAAKFIEAHDRSLEPGTVDAAPLGKRRDRVRPLQIPTVEPGLEESMPGLAVPQG